MHYTIRFIENLLSFRSAAGIGITIKAVNYKLGEDRNEIEGTLKDLGAGAGAFLGLLLMLGLDKLVDMYDGSKYQSFQWGFNWSSRYWLDKGYSASDLQLYYKMIDTMIAQTLVDLVGTAAVAATTAGGMYLGRQAGEEVSKGVASVKSKVNAFLDKVAVQPAQSVYRFFCPTLDSDTSSLADYYFKPKNRSN